MSRVYTNLLSILRFVDTTIFYNKNQIYFYNFYILLLFILILSHTYISVQWQDMFNNMLNIDIFNLLNSILSLFITFGIIIMRLYIK